MSPVVVAPTVVAAAAESCWERRLIRERQGPDDSGAGPLDARSATATAADPIDARSAATPLARTRSTPGPRRRPARTRPTDGRAGSANYAPPPLRPPASN